MKLKEAIKERTVVWCKTEDEAVRILTEANRLGYKWSNGVSYMDGLNWDVLYSNCYNLKGGLRGDVRHYKEIGYTIINSTEIKTPPQWVPAPQDLIDPETQKSVLEAIEEVDKPVEAKALNTQIGGDHYRKYKIQPMEYAMANNLNACQFNVVKYITRYKDKNGIEDLQKAIHCINILIGFEEEEQRKVKQKEALIELINEI